MPPLINSFSIIVPVFNKEDEIISSLESIEASIAFFYEHQDSAHPVEAEVLIVNEASTDRTLDRITEFSQNKPHYTIINHSKSLGAGVARNTGAKISRGDILFFLDGDDLIFKEHIYLCFKLLNHHPETATETAFVLDTDRGSCSINLPDTMLGAVRTGVYMKDKLHPYWKAAIENSIPQNLCVRRECHEFVEGFPEAPVYKKTVCEDIAYGLCVERFFKVCRVGLETVEYIRYPGNHFDRQLKKFQTPPEEYQDDTSPEFKVLHSIRAKLEQEKMIYLLDKFRRIEKTPDLLTILNWQKLGIEALSQNQFLEAIDLFEKGISLEPKALSAIKDPLAIAYNNQGSALRKQGQFEQAATYLKQALVLKPNLPNSDLARVHFNLGTVLKEQREFEQSRSYLHRALELEPNFSEAIAELSKVNYLAQISARGYQFSPNQPSFSLSVWEQYLSRFANTPDLNILEMGSGEGQFTCWLIDNLLTHDSARITCVNPPVDEARQQAIFDLEKSPVLPHLFESNVAKTSHLEKLIKHTGNVSTELRSLAPDTFHVAYLGHSTCASEVLENVLLIWGLVKVGGTLILDHYGLTTHSVETNQLPKVAIDAFLHIFNHKIKLLHQGYQVVLEKISE